MSLSTAEKKQYRAIAHNLNPIIIVGDKGLGEGLLEELKRSLHDHELIKVKLNVGDRDERAKLITEMATSSHAEVVQTIGKMAVLFKKNPKPNPKLSNLLR
jgi:RNA-binding protein